MSTGLAEISTRSPEPAEVVAFPPLGRLAEVCDPGSFSAIRSGVASRRRDEAADGDGVVAGAGTVGGQPVFCYAQDPSFMGGSLGAAHAESIVRVLELANRAKAPVIAFVESGGARLQEGHDALAGYGRIFRASVALRGVAPQISIVTGISAGGGAYAPALTDFIVMTEAARMFLTGPRVVRDALGEDVSLEALGGPGVHAANGVCQLGARDESEAIALTRELLALLRGPSESVALGAAPDPGATVPAEPRKVYDVRTVAAATLDDRRLLEVSPGWARSIVTGLGRIHGRPVGIVANQPRWLGGVINAEAAEKAALFVDSCDRFGLPLVALVDTPGFMPGCDQESAGVIRRGASLLRAFSAARVPKVTVVLRKAYGGAVITMNSKALGADFVFAWPGAEIGIMAATQAVGVVHRRDLERADDPGAARERLAAGYAAEHLDAARAARNGFVDEVIEPIETRERLAWALAAVERR